LIIESIGINEEINNWKGGKKKNVHGRERKEGKLKKKNLIELNEEINIGRDEKNMGERKRVNRDFKERKQKLRKEGKRQRVSWNSVRAEKLTWHALEKL
jgi:hypothetical protein